MTSLRSFFESIRRNLNDYIWNDPNELYNEWKEDRVILVVGSIREKKTLPYTAPNHVIWVP